MTTENTGYSIRAMSDHDVELALDWAAAEGWNPGLHDAPSFHAADPGGFFVGELDSDGGTKRVATISAVRYGAGFGFIGLYIVRPGYRGRGLGIAIWNAGLASLAGRNIGLDGVVAQQDNYRKSGFSLAYRNIRFAGMTGETMPVAIAPTASIVDARSIGFDALIEYDARFFPQARRSFVEAWIAQQGSIALAAIDDSRIVGWGAIRRCRNGFKIGPLNAATPGIADALFNALIGRLPPSLPIFLDVPEPNEHALALAQRNGMQRVFETARMYTGPFPELPMAEIYGVTTFELG